VDVMEVEVKLDLKIKNQKILYLTLRSYKNHIFKIIRLIQSKSKYLAFSFLSNLLQIIKRYKNLLHQL
jgi:hypothetical protein